MLYPGPEIFIAETLLIIVLLSRHAPAVSKVIPQPLPSVIVFPLMVTGVGLFPGGEPTSDKSMKYGMLVLQVPSP